MALAPCRRAAGAPFLPPDVPLRAGAPRADLGELHVHGRRSNSISPTAMAPFPSDAPLQLVPLLPSIFLCVRRASMAGAPSSSPSLLLAGEQRSNSPMDGAQKNSSRLPSSSSPISSSSQQPFPLLSRARRASLAPASNTAWPDLPPPWASLAVPCAQLSLSSTPHFLPWKKNQQRAPSSLSSVVPVGCSTKCTASRAVQQPIRDTVKTLGEKPPLFSMFIFRCV
jgi:hypothetical protein